MKQDISQEAQELKNRVLGIYAEIQTFIEKYPKAELPRPDNDFILAKDLLSKGDFNLAVCGKVKNGKSSLINALIGRNLLPTCTDVATSRVFKIAHGEADSFHVVYSNGDMKAISEAELSRYGSQFVTDEVGYIDADKSIAYIDVKTKMDFLPEGVSLLDTPGIGSTYPQHTAITKEYLKMADAVLFVVNPAPLEKTEIDFLKEVVEITPNIVFITTKIDESGIESVQNNIVGNTKKIKDAIGDKLYRDIKMLTMSSQLLLDATRDEDADSAAFNIELAGYNTVKEELLRIVFLTQGYYRVGIAFNAIAKYYQKILGTLNSRIDAAKKSGDEYQSLIKQYENACKEFSDKMGDKKRKSLMDEIDVILNVMDYDFTMLFSPKGELVAKFENEINELTADTIHAYGENFGLRIVTEAQARWNGLTETVYKKMRDSVNNFNEDCKMILPANARIVDPNGGCDPTIEDVAFKDKMSAARSEMLTAGMISTAAMTMANAVYFFAPALITPVIPVLAPALVILGVGTLVWGAISGNQIAIDRHLKKTQSQLRQYLYDTVNNCKKQLMEVSLDNNKYKSLYQGFRSSIRSQAQQSIDDIYVDYKKELDAMKTTLIESKQNPKLIEGLEYIKQEWGSFKNSLQEVRNLLTTYEL